MVDRGIFRKFSDIFKPTRIGEHSDFYIGLGKTVRWPKFPSYFPPPGSLTFADVTLLPRNSMIESRKNIDTSFEFGRYKLRFPIMSAPMDTVTGDAMVRKLAELGGIGTYPRQKDFEETLRQCETYSNEGIPCVYALGLDNAFDRAQMLKQRGASAVVIDVAHGGMETVKKAASEINSRLDLLTIAGNVATFEQAKSYQEFGIRWGRVGVGSGGVCTTRIETGVGVPQLSAVLDTAATGISVIADGGIKKPADVIKALAAGAKMVMIGSMFAGTTETPGEIINGKKIHRGQASRPYMNDNGNFDGNPEGIETEVDAIDSVEDIFYRIYWGVRSGMSYLGAGNLKELKENTVFEIVSSNAEREGRAHIHDQ